MAKDIVVKPRPSGIDPQSILTYIPSDDFKKDRTIRGFTLFGKRRGPVGNENHVREVFRGDSAQVRHRILQAINVARQLCFEVEVHATIGASMHIGGGFGCDFIETAYRSDRFYRLKRVGTKGNWRYEYVEKRTNS